MRIYTLPTLDGTAEAAVARLEAWGTRPMRERLAFHPGVTRNPTLVDYQDQLDLLLGVAS